MCDLCVELHKLKELGAFHVRFVVFLSQQDFGPASFCSVLHHWKSRGAT